MYPRTCTVHATLPIVAVGTLGRVATEVVAPPLVVEIKLTLLTFLALMLLVLLTTELEVVEQHLLTTMPVLLLTLLLLMADAAD